MLAGTSVRRVSTGVALFVSAFDPDTGSTPTVEMTLSRRAAVRLAFKLIRAALRGAD